MFSSELGSFTYGVFVLENHNAFFLCLRAGSPHLALLVISLPFPSVGRCAVIGVLVVTAALSLLNFLNLIFLFSIV